VRVDKREFSFKALTRGIPVPVAVIMNHTPSCVGEAETDSEIN